MPHTLLRRAEEFARFKHQHQTRKMSNIPYITHPLAVAQRVSGFTEDPEIRAAAVLHDVLEDTDTTWDELLQHFSQRICDIVKELTLDKEKYTVPETDENGKILSELEKQERKLELKVPYLIEKINHLSESARLIKFADRENNVADLRKADPIFASRYARETQFILQGIKISPNSKEKVIIQSILDKIAPFLP